MFLDKINTQALTAAQKSFDKIGEVSDMFGTQYKKFRTAQSRMMLEQSTHISELEGKDFNTEKSIALAREKVKLAFIKYPLVLSSLTLVSVSGFSIGVFATQEVRGKAAQTALQNIDAFNKANPNPATRSK